MECFKRINFKMIGATIIPIIGYFLVTLATGTQTDSDTLNKPALQPPGWVFAPVWTFLYLCMGFASYLVYRSGGEKLKGPASIPLVLYTLQLLLNWSWSPLYFAYQEITIAFYIIISLCIAIGITIISFFRLSIFAGLLLVPYLVWTSFATYLNYSIMVLNE
ncbi:tryptophan-rich protein TspO [Lepeophtheirus salmonis]|uniref:tryptophan-rich protein TspO n=1 Tax=Lepeophtheirus salmonis TaxID=72036 RepID=UPI001AE3FD95|nr:tryptophan-rich protein TspO-like [Lepeophtheirus salmonis]XP_040566451.1 tryptophan-rich protein TspO-like [Lepeophtheirus salmonis]